MGAIYSLLARALGSSSVAIVATAAAKIGSLVGRVVPASASAIVSAIRGWAGRNPGKLALAISTLGSVGIDLAADKVAEAFDADGITDAAALAVINDMHNRIYESRAKHSGDGDVKKTHGFTNEEYENVIVRQSVVNGIISKAVRHAGSIAAIQAIREAVFLEDVDFELYSRYKN